LFHASVRLVAALPVFDIFVAIASLIDGVVLGNFAAVALLIVFWNHAAVCLCVVLGNLAAASFFIVLRNANHAAAGLGVVLWNLAAVSLFIVLRHLAAALFSVCLVDITAALLANGVWFFNATCFAVVLLSEACHWTVTDAWACLIAGARVNLALFVDAVAVFVEFANIIDSMFGSA
jgi:hypothetical protein